jgi:hypothetical protein
MASEKVLLATIGSITIIESIALLMGMDGQLFMSSMAILGGIAGYKVRDIVKK